MSAQIDTAFGQRIKRLAPPQREPAR
jgi:hypothetical protein